MNLAPFLDDPTSFSCVKWWLIGQFERKTTFFLYPGWEKFMIGIWHDNSAASVVYLNLYHKVRNLVKNWLKPNFLPNYSESENPSHRHIASNQENVSPASRVAPAVAVALELSRTLRFTKTHFQTSITWLVLPPAGLCYCWLPLPYKLPLSFHQFYLVCLTEEIPFITCVQFPNAAMVSRQKMRMKYKIQLKL